MKKTITFFLPLLMVLLSTTLYAQRDPGQHKGDTGTVAFTYRSAPVTYKTIRAADSNIWAMKNLGATKVADSLLDLGARGDFFQWGRWDDGHQLGASTTGSIPSPNNPSAITSGSTTFYTITSGVLWWRGTSTDTWSSNPPSATNGLDPCAAMGAGWHIPSMAEWQTLFTKENIVIASQAYTSTIKLSAGGNRAGSSGFLSTTINANNVQNWTGTPIDTSAWSLNLPSVGNTSPFTNVPFGRASGRPVRCMKTKTNCTARIDTTHASICPGGNYTRPHGAVVTTAGIYVDSFSTVSGGCDSIIVTSLAVITSSTDTTHASICPGGNYTRPRGAIVSTAGIYIDTFRAAAGCDSVIVVTDLKITTLDTSITVVNDTTLRSNDSTATYQWLNCDNANAAVTGATSRTFVPTISGHYAVALSKNNCMDTSACYSVMITSGVATINNQSQVIVYPNPANTIVYIQTPVAVNVSVKSMDGKTLQYSQHATTINIAQLSEGVYMLQLTTDDGTVIKTEKLIKISK